MNQILEKIKKYSKPLEAKQSFVPKVIDEVSNLDTMVDKFNYELTNLAAHVSICDDIEHIIKSIIVFIDTYGGETIAYSPLTENSIIDGLKNKYPDKTFFSINSCTDKQDLKEKLSKTDIGITVADNLIAETGTVALFSNNEEGRLLSLLPRYNIILAKKESLLPDMNSFLNLINKKYGNNIPHSAIILITGPSRTADIEKILIIGVHGPEELLVVIF